MSDYEEVRALYEMCASEGVQAVVEAADKRIAEMEAALADAVEHPKTVLTCASCQKIAVVENCALTAAIERLKVCGNCAYENQRFGSCDDDVDEELPDSGVVASPDSCHFTPSRWSERSTP